MAWLLKSRRRVEPLKNDNSSTVMSSGSQASLSPSQLDTAIKEMLSITPPQNVCEEFCRGNPITPTGKRNQMVKMIFIVMLPMVVLTALTTNTFVITVRSFTSAAEIRDALNFSVDLGLFIHNLQIERDMSVLYLSNLADEMTKTRLLRRYPITDSSLENLSDWTLRMSNKRDHFKNKDKFINYLNRHRYELSTLNQSVPDEMLFYSNLIDIFVSWLYDAVTEARSGFIWRALVGYCEVIRSKENTGQERSLGLIYFTRGHFPDRRTYLWFCESQDFANTTFISARYYSPSVGTFYNENIKTTANKKLLEDLQSMRKYVRQNSPEQERDYRLAEYWYSNMTELMDLLFQTQRQVAEELINRLASNEWTTIKKMLVISAVLLFVFMLSPVTIYAVFSLTNEIQKYSITLAERTKAISREKKRTDMLIYQMLPKTVAEQLKRDEEVAAESFAEATIFFSDIQGFTQISARSSPVQVVDMLNALYSHFDEELAKFDVYKVETIGDAYMVVSGIPTRNGTRHAAEIGTMALTLVDHIGSLEIPHLPGTRFKLRIGCHTGPVVAGVVGCKMPRYCLFGETVSVSAKMESLGKPGRVHISQTTYEALMGIGGFEMEERPDDVCKWDRELLMFFKGSVTTYWLVHKEGLERIRSPSSKVSTGESDGEPGMDDDEPWARGKLTNVIGDPIPYNITV